MCSADGFPEKLMEFINKIAETEKYLTYNIYTKPISTGGGNFTSDLYEVDIKGETKDGDQELNLFVKSHKGFEPITFLPTKCMFAMELFAYKELLETFTELEEDANVPEHERFKMVKCYGENTTDVIIFKNMKKNGFKTLNRRDVVPLKFAEMSIKHLAKMHALSFVLEEKRPEYFNTVIKDIRFGFINNDDWQTFMKNMIETTAENVDDKIRQTFESACYKLAEKYGEYFKDEACKRCICHGDYKNINILTKVIDGEVTDVIPVDYQLLHYGCPALDFIYFIFLGTDKQFRDAHLSHLKDLYHGTLGKFLEYFNMNVENVYPRKIFDDDYKKKLSYGLLVSFAFLPALLVSSGTIPETTEEIKKTKLHISEEYKNRQRGFIEEFIEWGYIA